MSDNEEKTIKRPQFYETGFIPFENTNEEFDKTVNLSNPVSIKEYLLKHVYKQEKYCRDAAMILYDHLKGIRSCNFVCGPSGSGKTYVMEVLKRIFPRIVIINSANLSKDGWNGDNKVLSFLDRVDMEKQDYIVVFDEFDKCVCSKTNSANENVSESIMSEFLKLVEGEIVTVKREGNNITYDTSKMTFVFCGSFAEKAKAIAKKESNSGFGFSREEKHVKAFEKELELDDLIDYGLITELASRVTRLINVRPLTMEDFEYLLTEHPGSPIKLIESKYSLKLNISPDKCSEIARNAFKSGLGVRNANAQLQRIVDDTILQSFESSNKPPKVINI